MYSKQYTTPYLKYFISCASYLFFLLFIHPSIFCTAYITQGRIEPGIYPGDLVQLHTLIFAHYGKCGDATSLQSISLDFGAVPKGNPKSIQRTCNLKCTQGKSGNLTLNPGVVRQTNQPLSHCALSSIE